METSEAQKDWEKCKERRRPNRIEMAWLVGILIFFLILALYISRLKNWVAVWVLMMLMLVFFIGALGRFSICRWMGIFINDRNRMSLSRFQTILWTVIFISAFFTIILINVTMVPSEAVPVWNCSAATNCTAANCTAGGDSCFDPFAISIDPKLWALLGISITSLVGAPLIDGNKERRDPKGARHPDGSRKTKDEEVKEIPAVKRAQEITGIDAITIWEYAKGILYANPTPYQARFTDMFEGDELENVGYISVAKVQMFFFTVIVVPSGHVSGHPGCDHRIPATHGGVSRNPGHQPRRVPGG
jgi:hypothetical protein